MATGPDPNKEVEQTVPIKETENDKLIKSLQAELLRVQMQKKDIRAAVTKKYKENLELSKKLEEERHKSAKAESRYHHERTEQPVLKELAYELAVKTRAKYEANKEIHLKINSSLVCKLCNVTLIKPCAMSCGHLFCQFCATEWKKKSDSCPICDKPASLSEPLYDVKAIVETMMPAVYEEDQERRDEEIKKRPKEFC